MQVKEIDINTGKIKRYGICTKKSTKSPFRWSYHSDLTLFYLRYPALLSYSLFLYIQDAFYRTTWAVVVQNYIVVSVLKFLVTVFLLQYKISEIEPEKGVRGCKLHLM